MLSRDAENRRIIVIQGPVLRVRDERSKYAFEVKMIPLHYMHAAGMCNRSRSGHVLQNTIVIKEPIQSWSKGLTLECFMAQLSYQGHGMVPPQIVGVQTR